MVLGDDVPFTRRTSWAAPRRGITTVPELSQGFFAARFGGRGLTVAIRSMFVVPA
jgi:hypothetical protein